MRSLANVSVRVYKKVRERECVCMCVCARARERVQVHMRVRVRVRVRVRMRASDYVPTHSGIMHECAGNNLQANA